MNNYLSRYFLIILAVHLSICSIAQTKRALIVGIGSYPAESGWSKIHGDNDVPLIKQVLQNKGFEKDRIVCLKNEYATKKQIVSTLKSFIAEAKPKDQFYIHFSTHGQQVTDQNGDEEDGLDEAIIPYDAKKTFGMNGYHGENHLIDDELNGYLASIRKKIGKSGSLLVVIDACHSGDATRGRNSDTDTLIFRGTSEVFQLPKKTDKTKRFLPSKLDWVVISASLSNQRNYEYALGNTYYGSLSFSLKLALGELTVQDSFTDLFRLITSKRVEMNVSGYPQRPMIEGDDFYQRQKAF